MPLKNSNLRTVSKGGQISLGKQFAGQQVIIEEIEEGSWVVKTVVVLPKVDFQTHLNNYMEKQKSEQK